MAILTPAINTDYLRFAQAQRVYFSGRREGQFQTRLNHTLSRIYHEVIHAPSLPREGKRFGLYRDLSNLLLEVLNGKYAWSLLSHNDKSLLSEKILPYIAAERHFQAQEARKKVSAFDILKQFTGYAWAIEWLATNPTGTPVDSAGITWFAQIHANQVFCRTNPREIAKIGQYIAVFGQHQQQSQQPSQKPVNPKTQALRVLAKYDTEFAAYLRGLGAQQARGKKVQVSLTKIKEARLRIIKQNGVGLNITRSGGNTQQRAAHQVLLEVNTAYDTLTKTDSN